MFKYFFSIELDSASTSQKRQTFDPVSRPQTKLNPSEHGQSQAMSFQSSTSKAKENSEIFAITTENPQNSFKSTLNRDKQGVLSVNRNVESFSSSCKLFDYFNKDFEKKFPFFGYRCLKFGVFRVVWKLAFKELWRSFQCSHWNAFCVKSDISHALNPSGGFGWTPTECLPTQCINNELKRCL